MEETNRYADQFVQQNKDNLREFSRVHAWKNTTIEEMRTFFGLLGLMGVVHKPRLDMY